PAGAAVHGIAREDGAGPVAVSLPVRALDPAAVSIPAAVEIPAAVGGLTSVLATGVHSATVGLHVAGVRFRRVGVVTSDAGQRHQREREPDSKFPSHGFHLLHITGCARAWYECPPRRDSGGVPAVDHAREWMR